MRILQLFFLCFILFASTACSTLRQPPMPVGNLVLGVAPFTHPKDFSQMLAGYMSEDVRPVSPEILSSLDTLFAQELRDSSKNTFKDSSLAIPAIKSLNNSSSRPMIALNYWAAIGKDMKVDILIVPQVLEWQERQGSSLGITKPARVVLDFFVVNVKDSSLISRSHTDEEQTALSENLLEIGKFFKRGGKWISGHELAQEAMKKAIKELGL